MMLSPYRVLDLTNERGMLCGQILGDLGADVIVIEPPGGSSARCLGPFYQDIPHPDRSLFWWAYNRNKRGITLDITSAEGQNLLKRLVAEAHFFLESDSLGTLAAWGLGYEDLAAINPSLIYVSITPFGQDGPKTNYAASDLMLLAASGPLILTGDDDRPPVRVGVPQAYLHAGAEAAGAALVAHHARQRTGHGQHVDVSAQQAIAQATMSAILAAPVGDAAAQRFAGGAKVGPFTSPGGVKIGPLIIRMVWSAADGYVTLAFSLATFFAPFNRRLIEWMYEEDFCDAATFDIDWEVLPYQLTAGPEALETFERVQDMVAIFLRAKTKAELWQGAIERQLLLAPLVTTDEIVASEQLAARSYWQDVQHPEWDQTFRYPGPFAKSHPTPIIYRYPPPGIGEHNHTIYADELGLSASHIHNLHTQGVI